jgi:hypothetical protein
MPAAAPAGRRSWPGTPAGERGEQTDQQRGIERECRDRGVKCTDGAVPSGADLRVGAVDHEGAVGGAVPEARPWDHHGTAQAHASSWAGIADNVGGVGVGAALQRLRVLRGQDGRWGIGVAFAPFGQGSQTWWCWVGATRGLHGFTVMRDQGGELGFSPAGLNAARNPQTHRLRTGSVQAEYSTSA